MQSNANIIDPAGSVRQKVFCIGFQKTGTKSMAKALLQSGYRVTGPNGTMDPLIAQRAFDLVTKLSHQFDAFQDNPWPLYYREMDELHPGSKFVLTIRDPSNWIASVCRYFGRYESPMRSFIYGHGSPIGHESAYLRRFEQHNRDVAAYFRDRPFDFMSMDLEKGDGWERLCGFLNIPMVTTDFPHLNQGTSRTKP